MKKTDYDVLIVGAGGAMNHWGGVSWRFEPSVFKLLSQTLRGWTADTNFIMDTIAVCSDRKVTKSKGIFSIMTIRDFFS